MGFPRQEYCTGLPFPSPGDLPDPRMNPCLLNRQVDSIPLSHQGSPSSCNLYVNLESHRELPPFIQSLSCPSPEVLSLCPLILQDLHPSITPSYTFSLSAVLFLVAKSRPALLWPHALQPSRLLCPWDFPGKSTGLSCHFLLHGIFLIQGSNSHLWIGRWILYQWATGETSLLGIFTPCEPPSLGKTPVWSVFF